MRLIPALSVLMLLLCSPALAESHSDEVSSRIDALFDHLEEHQLFRGAALVADGGLPVYTTARGLADEAWNIPNGVDTRYRIASLSKQFAAVVALQLADEGRLSLGDPLATHLGELPEAWSGKVAVWHLLNQTSGIPDYTLLPGYREGLSTQRFTREEFLQLICGDSLFAETRFEPGSDWEYSNTNYFLLGVLIDRVTGASYEDELKRRILTPLEMHDSGIYDSREPVPMLAEGYELSYEGKVERPAHSEFSPKSVPSGGIYSTVRDMLKWCAALNEGALLTPAMDEVFTTPTLYISDDMGYACGQWCEPRESPYGERVKLFSHGGSTTGMSTWLLRAPSDGRCVVLLHNGGSGREMFLEQVALTALEILEGGEGELPPLDLVGPLASTYLNHPDSLLDHYRLLKEKHREVYDFRPEQLSMIGQLLVQRVGDRETAAAVFRLNVEEYPDAPLAHRDLGDFLLEEGVQEQALEHLLRARELTVEPDEELDAMISRASAGG